MTLQNASQNSSSRRQQPVQCFSVTGAADPGLMPRIMELWAKRGLVPDRWHGGRAGPGGCDVDIDIETSELDHGLARADRRSHALHLRRLSGAVLGKALFGIRIEADRSDGAL